MSAVFAEPQDQEFTVDGIRSQVVHDVVEIVGRVLEATPDTLVLAATAVRRAGQTSPEGLSQGSVATVGRNRLARVEVIAGKARLFELAFAVGVGVALVAFLVALSALGGGGS